MQGMCSRSKFVAHPAHKIAPPINDRTIESRGGISPPRAPRTVREPLDSYGSQRPALPVQ